MGRYVALSFFIFGFTVKLVGYILKANNNINMDYRRKKQTFIISLLVVFFALVGTGIYFKYIKAKPTCFDGVRNQNEENLDCGGPCVSCERRTIKNIETEWAIFVNLKDNRYDMAAKVVNPNPNFGLARLNYSFNLYDSSGQLIKEQKGRDYILPGGSKYLIEMNVDAGQPVSKVELALVEPLAEEWLRVNEQYSAPSIFVQNKTFRFLDEGSDRESEASGTIKNNSDFDLDSVEVSIILFDENKNPIGINKTLVRTLSAGEERHFSALWYEPLRGAVKSFDMLAQTNLFSDENFLRRYGTVEKFQEYETGN